MRLKIILCVASLALIIALVFIWRQVKPPAVTFNRSLRIGIGQWLADETVRALHDHGRIVVVIVEDARGPSTRVLPPDGRWDGFHDELKQHGTIEIVATEFVPNEIGGLWGCSAEGFQKVWKQHADVDAIVSFDALPAWNDVSASIQPDRSPKLIVANTEWTPNKIRYAGYFASGGLVSLLAARLLTAPEQAEPITPREWFEKYFQAYTAQNYESLPD